MKGINLASNRNHISIGQKNCKDADMQPVRDMLRI